LFRRECTARNFAASGFSLPMLTNANPKKKSPRLKGGRAYIQNLMNGGGGIGFPVLFLFAFIIFAVFGF